MSETTELVKATNGVVAKIPTLQELVETSEQDIKDNALMVLLNQPPPAAWVQKHPMTHSDYLPIERVEYLLTRIFGKWWTEIKEVKVLANSVTVVVRLYVVNPITKQTEWNDGVGAMAIQTDKGQGAMDWNYAKSDGVMKAAPGAKSYAVKDAAEQFGKLFGKDLSRKQQIDYTTLLKPVPHIEEGDLRELYELKKESLTAAEKKDAKRILDNKETSSYSKLQTLLKSK